MPKHPAELRVHAIQLARAFGIHIIEVPLERNDHPELFRLIAHTIAPRYGITPDEFFQMSGAAAGRRGTRTEGQIRTPYIESELTYAGALHEIGHIAHPGGDYDIKHPSPAVEYEQECHAWEFAQRHALVWTEKMTAVMRLGLDSYRMQLHRAA